MIMTSITPTFMLYDVIADILSLIGSHKNSDKELLQQSDIQQKIKELKALDMSILLPGEQLPELKNHTPARIMTFLLSYYAEHALVDAIISIKEDDPNWWISHNKPTHINTYRLKLHNADSHEKLFANNASPYQDNHDIDTIFISQQTYSNLKLTDTTMHPYESFLDNNSISSYSINRFPHYEKPYRKIEVKSLLWKSGKNIHNADCVLKAYKDGFKLLDPTQNFKIKDCDLKLTSEGQSFYDKYCEALELFNNLKDKTWDEFIIG